MVLCRNLTSVPDIKPLITRPHIVQLLFNTVVKYRELMPVGFVSFVCRDLRAILGAKVQG